MFARRPIYKCHCTCGTDFYIQERGRYSTKCPNCGTATKNINKTNLIEYSIWDINALGFMLLVLFGFGVAFIAGYGISIVSILITLLVIILGILVLGYTSEHIDKKT